MADEIQDFDDLLSKKRVFRVRGEVFSWHDVRPEVLSALGDKITKNGKLTPWESIDMQISLFLSESDRKRWRELRERDTDPVTIVQVQEVIGWLVATQTDRPTNLPSPSASGRGTTAA